MESGHFGTVPVEISIQAREFRWSSTAKDNNFREAYRTMCGSKYSITSNTTLGDSTLGAFQILPNRFIGRFLQWESCSGFVCLRETWLENELLDSSLCIRIGGKIFSIKLLTNFILLQICTVEIFLPSIVKVLIRKVQVFNFKYPSFQKTALFTAYNWYLSQTTYQSLQVPLILQKVVYI